MISEFIKNLRTKHNMTQEDMAEKLMVTRQDISRWETGETEPNIESLKLISKIFDVSINDILGIPNNLICQCCGMPLDVDLISEELDGSFNKDYCKWCYVDGEFIYKDIDSLVDFLESSIPSEEHSKEEIRKYYKENLEMLNHWKVQ